MGGTSNNDSCFGLHSNINFRCKNVNPIDIYGSFFSEGILKDLPNFEPKCRFKYEVDSVIAVTTKSVMDKLREMFEIFDNIGIFFSRCEVIPSNPL